MSLPSGFMRIKDVTPAHLDKLVSLIGVISKAKEAEKSKGTDWVFEFEIQDEFANGQPNSDSTIRCRLFRADKKDFPTIYAVGDIAIVRGALVKEWMGRIHCIGDYGYRTQVLVFDSKKVPVPELSEPYRCGSRTLPFTNTRGAREPLVAEQMSVIQMKHSASGSIQAIKQNAISTYQPARKGRQSLIKDLKVDVYSDIRAQVVNMYWKTDSSTDLKVTDYTTHKDLFNYLPPDDPDNWSRDKSWSGPFGQMTLSITLFGSNGEWARNNIKDGDFVFLRNVHIKISPLLKLEGAMHEDRQYPHKVDIRKLSAQSDITEIKQRKAAYEKNLPQQDTPQQSAFDQLQNEPQDETSKSSKSALKKARKRERQQLQKLQEAEEAERSVKLTDEARNTINQNVVAAHPQYEFSTISAILHNTLLKTHTDEHNELKLPFVNCRYRCRVRVVDFFPPELHLFTHNRRDPSWNESDRVVEGGWEWGFFLLLEDAVVPHGSVSEKLRVVVNNEAAQFLELGNARNLKNDTQALKRLEEKLFILWGNLFELKTERRQQGNDLPLPPGDNRMQNRPFDCCIEEYGHEAPVSDKNPSGFQRMHVLALTKIRS